MYDVKDKAITSAALIENTENKAIKASSLVPNPEIVIGINVTIVAIGNIVTKYI